MNSKQARRVFIVAEITNICRIVVHPLHQAVITTLAKTAIGVGELCNLDLEDVDLSFLTQRDWNDTEDPFLRVRYGGQIPHRRERVATTYIPVDEELEHVLKQWLLVCPDMQGRKTLFCSVTEWGSRLTPSMARNIVGRYYDAEKDAQMNKLTPLAFRYFFEERFSGPPLVGKYILKGADTENSLSDIHDAYRDSIYILHS